MNTTQIIDTLRKEVSVNPAFNAFMHVCALRERARNQVTIQALHYRMEKEGFSFSKPQYQQVIKILADLGFGTLKFNKRAEPIGIFGVTQTLQSIGKAALGGDSKLKPYRKRHKFSDLPNLMAAKEPRVPLNKVAEKVQKVETIAKVVSAMPRRIYPVSLTVQINKKPVNFRIPTDINANEIADLISAFVDRVEGADSLASGVDMIAVVDGKPISLPLPKDMAPKDIAGLVVKFHDKGNA